MTNPARAFDIIRATTTEQLQQRINLARSVLGHHPDGASADVVKQVLALLEGRAA